MSFIVEFTFDGQLFDGAVHNVAGNGDCFWLAVSRATGLPCAMLKQSAAACMAQACAENNWAWQAFQNYVGGAEKIGGLPADYMVLEYLRTGRDPATLIRGKGHYAEEWMFPFASMSLGRDIVVVAFQGRGKGYRAYAPFARAYELEPPVFVYKENTAHYRAVELG